MTVTEPKPEKDSLEYLLQPEKRVEVKLESALAGLPGTGIVLVVIESEHYSGIENGLVDFLKKNHSQGVFVSVNKPLVNLFAKEGRVLEEKQIVFLDAISESSHLEKLVGSNVRYLDSPQNLEELVGLVEQEMQSMPKEGRFLVLDSISTLLLYNKPDTVERFAHNLTGKLRSQHAFGVLLMIRLKENQDSIRVISQFCDYTIEIKEEESKME